MTNLKTQYLETSFLHTEFISTFKKIKGRKKKKISARNSYFKSDDRHTSVMTWCNSLIVVKSVYPAAVNSLHSQTPLFLG